MSQYALLNATLHNTKSQTASTSTACWFSAVHVTFGNTSSASVFIFDLDSNIESGQPYGAKHDVMILSVTVESYDSTKEPWGSNRRHPCVSFYELPGSPGDLCGDALCKRTHDEWPHWTRNTMDSLYVRRLWNCLQTFERGLEALPVHGSSLQMPKVQGSSECMICTCKKVS